MFLGAQCAVLTAGPARLADHFAIELPYPRYLDLKTTDTFGEHTRRICHLLGLE